jgi:peptidyl-prolyl cis-trans isomerase C
VQFLALGGLLFAASALVEARRDGAARRIVVDDTVVKRLAALYQAQIGRPPSREQLEALVEQHVREEVQFREARRLGLDKDDEIVRRRLASKLDFLERDTATVPEPSAGELQRYYAAHEKDFVQPATAAFTHVYFSPDRGGDSAARARAEKALAALQASRRARAPELGDPFPLQTDFAGVARLDVAQQFGSEPMAESVFAGPLERWSGPVRSGYGWHLVYVSRREDARVPPLAEVLDKVEAACVDAAKEQANRERYAALEKRYVVERTYRR